MVVDPDELLTLGGIAKMLKIHSKTLWAWVREGSFPKPFAIHGREMRWRGRDYLWWLDQKVRENPPV